jgi:hypothetical protein
MGENNKEKLLKLLREWRSLSLKQKEVLSQRNLEQFEKLTNVSELFQTHINELISHFRPTGIDQTALGMLKEIQSIQSDLVSELKKGVCELSETIRTLRKNKTSMKGYRQVQTQSPRFKSERT